MSPQLSARNGDPQAVKVLIAAEIAGKAVDVAATSSPAATPFPAVVSLTTEGGICLSEPNAIAKYIGQNKLQPAALASQIEQWLEWESNTLRPAVYSGSEAATAAALDELAAASNGRTFLVGEAATLADVAVFGTLLPLWDLKQVSGAAQRYLEGLAALPPFSAGIAKALGNTPREQLARVFQQDAAAAAAAKPKLPIPGQRNVLITSALPYVNNVPHLGNIIGCVLSADVYARYCRLRGYNAIYVCGTDEYGTATETKALEEGLTCQEICDKYHAIHADIYEWFGISFDKFGRTPTRHQTQIAQSIFQSLEARGQLVEQEMEQLFSEALGKFLADRFVAGTCPKCGYEDARGDQCDNCGSLLNPTELINPKCKITGTTPVVRKTRHVFLDLPQLSDRLQDYITRTSQDGAWSANCVAVTNAWMRDGLKPRCITRDLRWGTPVPREGYEEKVFYVWFDAPIGYISITANYQPDWKAWWQNPEEVELVQFMGKDNVPFHTVIFPATLLGTGEPWTMMRRISVTEYLNYEGGKFSKSRGTGVFGNDAKETGIPVEVWRYYLLSNRPEASDTDFKWSDLAAKNNSELLNNFGNLCNRVLKYIFTPYNQETGKGGYGGVIPTPHPSKGAEAVAAFGADVKAAVEEYCSEMERLRLKDGIRIAMKLSSRGNTFLQHTQFFAIKDREEQGTLIAAAAGVVLILASLVEPFLPTVTDKLLQYLDLPRSCLGLDRLLTLADRPQALIAELAGEGHRIREPATLFATIPEARVEELRARYGGSQADRESSGKAASSTAASTPSSSKKPAKGGAADGAGKAGEQGATTAGKKGKGVSKPAGAAGAGDGPESSAGSNTDGKEEGAKASKASKKKEKAEKKKEKKAAGENGDAATAAPPAAETAPVVAAAAGQS